MSGRSAPTSAAPVTIYIHTYRNRYMYVYKIVLGELNYRVGKKGIFGLENLASAAKH